jgi:DNA-binding transcriptional LysR family regulator
MVEPDLRNLAAFAAVARHRNFRRAARELAMSPAALSENLRALEEQLGVRLLNRTTRSVAPTEMGERLLQASSAADARRVHPVRDRMAAQEAEAPLRTPRR